MMRAIAALLTAALAGGCTPNSKPRNDEGAAPPVAQPPVPGGSGSSVRAPAPAPPPPASRGAGAETDTSTVARLEREARTLARTAGCGGAAACKVAPVGSRPCGGPRTYIAYCAASTDTVALFRKLDELKRLEEAFNRARGAVSTCEFRTPPAPTWVGGRCGTGASNTVM